MNVLIADKYREELKNIGIEISGVLEGKFSAEQIIKAFMNYYYDKVIIDVTSLKNASDASAMIIELKKIFTFLNPFRSIVLFENTPEFNNDIIKTNLVELKVYNYAFDIKEVIELYNNPKSYEEVMEYNNSGSSLVNDKSRIIGVKNVTDNAGATTLVYMMQQELSKKYRVKALEIGKDDFKHFQNENMKSIDDSLLMKEILEEPYPDVILIDQNDYENEFLIKENIYLIEPSILKLNKKLEKDPKVLEGLKDKKVVLNRTSMPLSKLEQFEKETKLKVFDIIRNVNERDQINTQVINLLTKLGFNRLNNGNIINDDTEKRKSIF